MSSLYDYMFETSFIEEVQDYLATFHGILARVVDDEEKPVPPDNRQTSTSEASRFFAFKSNECIGGLLCTAESQALLDQAAPHIQICVSGIDQLFQREIVLEQTGNEMLQLSEQLHFLFNLANKVIGLENLEEFCSTILREISEAIEADYALIETSALWKKGIKINWNLPADRAEELENLGFLQGKTAGDRTVIYSLTDGTSTLVAPIRGKEGTIGYMSFFKNIGNPPFSAYQKKFVSIIENIYSPTIETIRLYNSLQEIYLNTVKALAAAIDAKDEYTHGHSFRVARYAVSIGKRMDFEGQKLKDLEIAAYMHDLGKIGVPEAILGKPDKLTVEEYAEIKKHPVYTNKILQPINLSEVIIDAAVHHHERIDGSGYPHGLRGDKISPLARIIAVADVFDALTSQRPYRQAMPVETALKVLCEEIDVKLDRQVVLAFVAALKEEKLDTLLAEIDISLSFREVNNLNDFLVDLIDFLLPEYDKGKEFSRLVSGQHY